MKLKAISCLLGSAILGLGTASAEGPIDGEIYGKINVSFQNKDITMPGTTGVSYDEWELVSNASRLGYKGETDLDGELSVFYKAEFEISVDDGDKSGQTFTQRNIYAGLKGSAGSIKVGKFDTSTKLLSKKVDIFNDLAGDIKNLVVGEIRANNSIAYTTPELGKGFTLGLTIIPGEAGAEPSTTPGALSPRDGIADATIISAHYKTDVFSIGLSIDSEIQDGLDLTDFGFASTVDALMDITRLAGQFKLNDNVTLGAFYQMAELSEGNATADLEQDSIIVSAAFGISENTTVKVRYGLAENTLTSGGVEAADIETTQMSLGVDNKIGKKTKIFAYYTEFDGDNALSDEDFFGLGMEHKF